MKAEIPTPTLFITDIGTLAIAPKLIFSFPELIKAVQMGMDLDDFRDFEVKPRPLIANNYPNLDAKPSYPLYQKFERSLNNLRKTSDSRTQSNTNWFISKINYLEGIAVSVSENDWNLEKIKKYREDVALVWALYLSSLYKKSSLKINEVTTKKGFDSSEWLDWAKSNTDKYTVEKNYTLRLFYSALVFQVVSDYGKKDFAKEKSIPGFHSHTDAQHVSAILYQYLEQAIRCGCNKNFLMAYLKTFNGIQTFLSKFAHNSGVKQWLYS